MTARLTPVSVSAALRRAGVTTVSPADRNREGVKVTRGYNASRVTVTVDVDVEGIAVRRAALVTEALTDLGYVVEANPHSATILTVTRPYVCEICGEDGETCAHSLTPRAQEAAAADPSTPTAVATGTEPTGTRTATVRFQNRDYRVRQTTGLTTTVWLGSDRVGKAEHSGTWHAVAGAAFDAWAAPVPLSAEEIAEARREAPFATDAELAYDGGRTATIAAELSAGAVLAHVTPEPAAAELIASSPVLAARLVANAAREEEAHAAGFADGQAYGDFLTAELPEPTAEAPEVPQDSRARIEAARTALAALTDAERAEVLYERGALVAPDGGAPIATQPCWHVTTAAGHVYGVAAESGSTARVMVQARLTSERSGDGPRSAERVGTWAAAYGTVLCYR